MKKTYFLLFALAFFAIDTNAQLIDDDFESYSTGSMGSQNPSVWRTWSGGFDTGEDLLIEFGLSNSGDQSGSVQDNGVQDVVLQLGNLTTGDYTLQFQMYVFQGATGYFNIQGTVPGGPLAGVFNSGNIYFNETGATPGQGEEDSTGATFSFPEETWFPVSIYFDLAGPTYQMTVNGVLAHNTPVPFAADNTLGGIDFFSVNANNLFNIDDVLFVSGVLGTESFDNKSFSVYPNPVTDILNIKTRDAVNKVSVYNVLGKLVYSATPNALSPTVNMSAMKTGVYFVEVTIGNATKTVKVIR
jgi:hypothetical protein